MSHHTTCLACKEREFYKRRNNLVAHANKRIKALRAALPHSDRYFYKQSVINELHAWMMVMNVEDYIKEYRKEERSESFEKEVQALWELIDALLKIEETFSDVL